MTVWEHHKPGKAKDKGGKEKEKMVNWSKIKSIPLLLLACLLIIIIQMDGIGLFCSKSSHIILSRLGLVAFVGSTKYQFFVCLASTQLELFEWPENYVTLDLSDIDDHYGD